MPRRGRGGRFVKGASRRRRVRRARLGAIRQRGGAILGTVRARTRSAFRGIPGWAKPSTFAAGTGVAVGVTELLFTPTTDGDSWIRQLQKGYGAYKESGNPLNVLVPDDSSTNVTTVLAAQMKQNAGGAVLTIAGFGLGAAILKYFGM